MKKFISLTLLACLCLTLLLYGCTEETESTDNSQLKIVATIFPQYDFAREIAGDKAQVQMLITPGTESHSFEPTTSDIMDINTCDIFIYTGGESDTWIDNLLKNTDNPNMEIISLMECVNSGNNEEDHHHSGHNHTDEHVWTSPVNAMEISKKICHVLCTKDPGNSSYYKANLETYLNSLDELDKSFENIVSNASRNTFVFADRFPLAHFATEYGLEHCAAFSGCSEDTEPSAATVATLIDKVRDENIPVILKIELSSDSIANTISKETGAKVMTFYSCHNISSEDFDTCETYLSLMQKNVQTLREALN